MAGYSSHAHDIHHKTLSVLNARLQLAIGNIDQSLSYLEFAIEAAPEKKIDSNVG